MGRFTAPDTGNSAYSSRYGKRPLDIVFRVAYLSAMSTATQATTTIPEIPHAQLVKAERSPLPPGFDLAAWLREVCERSGVSMGVTDPVALAKLRTLTCTDADR